MQKFVFPTPIVLVLSLSWTPQNTDGSGHEVNVLELCLHFTRFICFFAA